MEMKAFELEDCSSEASKKEAESNSAGVSQPFSKVANDRLKDWVDSVSSHAPPDVASAPGLLAFTHSFMQFTPVIVITMSTQHRVTLEPIVMDIGLRLILAVQAFCHCKLLFHLSHSQLIICILVHTCYHHCLLFLYRL